MRTRIAVAALALSAAGLVGIATHEGYTDRAVIPVPGDVPTVGFGTTRRDDGTPIQMGDTTTPQRALRDLLRDVGWAEEAIQQCANVPMFPHEFDTWVSFIYNVGAPAFCRSTAARKLREGDYAGACDELLRWVHVDGRVIRGLVNRREAERRKCLGL
jgi:lysozyme